MEQTVRRFFENYERANASSDSKAIGALYADTFMFGGPDGVQAVEKEVLLQVIPKRKAHFDSMGLCETPLKTLSASALDSKYLLAKVGWTMTVRNATGESKMMEVFTTYVLQHTGADLSIVFQIDHQDLATTIARHPRT